MRDSDPVRVWQFELPRLIPFVDRLQGTLSADEKARGTRFHFSIDRDRYTVARGLLRLLLAASLDRTVGEVEIRYGPYGKPLLADDPAMHFNVSHSHEVILIGLGYGRELGVDVEWLGRRQDLSSITERAFSHSEQTALAQVSARDRPHAFLTCWTRKEAYVKARGEGLMRSFDGFSVPVGPMGQAEIREGPNCWTLRDVETGTPDYVAAVAAAGTGWTLACHTMDDRQLSWLLERCTFPPRIDRGQTMWVPDSSEDVPQEG
jgi:4'-phosphopantetheinyl transferase